MNFPLSFRSRAHMPASWPTLCACAVALVASGCIAPTNPCDPSADLAVRAQGTRISGVVRDTDGRALGGVVLSIAGRSETVVSADDGTFSFVNLPPAASYEVVALAQAPSVGGRTRTEALTCGGVLDGVELLVVVPPPSPEVELVKASGDRRLLVAFAGILPVADSAMSDDGGGMYAMPEATAEAAGEAVKSEDVMTLCKQGVSDAQVTFRVQLRTPFGAWQDAVVTPFPWSTAPPDGATSDDAMTRGELLDSSLFTERLDDFCAAALCSQFRYLDESLDDDQARCAEVVGVIRQEDGDADDVIEPLEPYASYHVRVLAERNTPAALQEAAALPARVEGALASRTGQMSLVPAALLPVADGDGTLLDPRGDDVLAVIPTANGRFAIVATEEVLVVGDGADAMAEDARATFAGPYLALARDTMTSEMLTNELFALGNVRASLGFEPAGAWARVIGVDDTNNTRTHKLYLGVDTASGNAGPSPAQIAANALRPSFPFDVEHDTLGAPVAVSYLLQSATPLVTEGERPIDAYITVYPSAMMLTEQRVNAVDAAALEMTTLTSTAAYAGWGDGLVADAAGAVSNLALSGPSCAALTGDAMDGVAIQDRIGVSDTQEGAPNLESTRAAACFDFEAALGEVVSLTDHDVLPVSEDPLETFHMLTDAANDRVFAVKTRDLLCTDCVAPAPPLAARLRADAVPVGRDPGGMSRSRLLVDCSNNSETTVPVVLVANRKGGDVSVLGVVDDAIEEMHIVPVPANVTEFLDDGTGPTCADPFAWAIAEDGRLFPIDMRGAPSTPLCDDRPCEVGTRGRGVAGAIGRRDAGPLMNRARVVVGGPGLVGEVGYFAPKAPAGGAYEARDDMSGSGSRDGTANPEP